MKIENIVGFPSGQIINITQVDLIKLFNKELIEYNPNVYEFLFNDKNIDKISEIVNTINLKDNCKIIDTDKIGKVIDIIKSFSDELINGKDYSKVFNKGDEIYKLYFSNEKTGLYLKKQLKKINPLNNIFIESL